MNTNFALKHTAHQTMYLLPFDKHTKLYHNFDFSLIDRFFAKTMSQYLIRYRSFVIMRSVKIFWFIMKLEGHISQGDLWEKRYKWLSNRTSGVSLGRKASLVLSPLAAHWLIVRHCFPFLSIFLSVKLLWKIMYIKKYYTNKLKL